MSGDRPAVLRAAVAYFAIVFAAGFLLGTIRTVVLAPRLGPFAAVLVEIPVMLAIAYVACRWLVARFAVPAVLYDRLVMGAVAFVLLIGAELLLALALGGSASGFLEALAQPAGVAGLAAQAVFAALPVLDMGYRRPPGAG